MFSKLLLRWHLHHNHRKMPWKGIKDPYKIWLSEIILQQTRVEQGEKYYHALLEKYPTIADLANADEATLYRLWQGLGYYNRCKNMLHTAQIITQQHQGKFPDTYDAIRQLKGIGPYTAAAIASFAFDLPYAVIDGNVVRILSRYFGLKIDFNQGQGKKEFEALAASLLDQKNNALFNQAMMDLGATICKPQNPLCGQCPFQKKCYAFLNQQIKDFPLKKIKPPLKHRYFHFMVIEYQDILFIHQRKEKDIWHNLYSFYMLETKEIQLEDFILLNKKNIKPFTETYTQQLTHQKIHGLFYKIKIENPKIIKDLGLISIQKTALKNFAFPRMIISFLENNHYLSS